MLAAAGPAQATTSTWLTTAPSTNWNNTTNWSGGVVPTGTNVAAFATTSAHSAIVINASGLSVGEITFSGTANESLTGTVANKLVINGVSNIDIDNQEANFTAQIGAALSLGSSGTQTFQVTGTGTAGLNFTNTVDLTGTTTIFKTTVATNLITFSGAIIESMSGGSLAITGSGTTVFTGANTYTEVTSIASGASLQIGNGGTTGQLGTASVVDLGTLVYDLSGSTTVSNAISGTGGTLVQKGGAASTLVLTGANTYTGATTITSGTIQLGNGVTNGSIAGTSIVDNSALIFDEASTSTYAGTISGSGTLTQAGTGTLLLTKVNTYTGDTTITSGTLQIGIANAIGNQSDVVVGTGGILSLNNLSDSIGSLAGGGAVNQGTGNLTLSDANSTTFSGTTTGSGTFTRAGTGTLTLTGALNTTGAVSISGGAIQVGNGTTNGTIAATSIVDSASLIYDVTSGTATTYAGTISGGGTVTKSGSGTLVLTGANTYIGATTITTGALQLGDGTTNGSIAGTSIVDSSALVFDVASATSSTYTGTITGGGSVAQTGSGTLVLVGANTYTGATTISGGTVQLGNGTTNGTIAGLSIVDNAALVFDEGSTTTYAGTISGGGSVTQAGTGTLLLTKVNTYTGDTTISSGTLQIGIANAIGNQSDVTVGSGGTLSLNNLSDSIGSLAGGGTVSQGTGNLTLADTNNTTFAGTTTGSGTFTRASTGTLTLTGALNTTGLVSISGGAIQVGDGATNGTIAATTIGAASGAALIYDVTTGTAVTYAGTISGAGSLIQTGAGTLVLTGTNTYTGVTTISSGTIQLGDGTTSGSIAGTSIVDNGALAYDVGTGTAVTYAGTISGGGTLSQTGAGTLILTGTNTYTGNTTLSAGTLQLGNGTLNGSVASAAFADNSALIDDVAAGTASTYAGAISGTGTLTKTGTGTLLLTGASNYSGGTTVSTGTLLAGGATAIGTASNISVAGGATLGVTGNSYMAGRTGLLTLASGATLLNSGGTNSFEGNVTLSGNATIEENAGGILYVGTGYVSSLPPPSRFNNTLNLGSNTLTLLANVNAPQSPGYDLAPGTGTWAPTNIFINTKVVGAGGLTIQGPGTVTLSAQNTNTYGGATWVQSGELVVDAKSGTVAVSGSSVIIGTSGGTSSAILQTGEGGGVGHPSFNYLIGSYNGAPTTSSSTSLVMYQNGTFDMEGGAEGFANLTMTGGTIDGGTSSLNTLLSIANGGTTGITTLASTSTALIENGNLGMGGNVFTYNIASGTTSSGVDLEIDSVIQNDRGFTNVSGGNINFVKSNTGTLLLQGDNTFSGITDVTGGILAIQNGGALGQASTGSALANGTVVETGAQLQLQQNPGGGGTNIDVAAETLTLNGTGISSTGSLLNASGSNTWGGFIYLNSASSIKANAGSTLTLGNPDPLTGGNPDPTKLASLIDGASGTSNQTLTFGGAGLIDVGGNIIGNIGTVIKTDSGTTILVGADTYTGATSVNAGALRLTNNASLHGTTVNVASGATIQLAQDAAGANISENSLATTINGAGNTGSNGAIENLNGSNTYNGAITLAGAAQINADASSTLNVAGTVTNGGNLLTVAGAGNTTMTGNISGTGGLTMAGTGTLTLNVTPGGVGGTTSGNTYSGVTSVSTGTLSMAQNYQVGTANQVAVASGATATINNTLQSVGTIAGNGTINFGTVAGGSTFGTAGSSSLQLNGASTFNGIFTGTGTIYIPTGASLTLGKNGANVIAVGGVNYNFYDPGLNIVLAGGTLNVNGTNDSFGTLTVTANSVLNFALGTGGPNSVLDFTGNSGVTGGVVINSGVTLNVTNWVNTVDYFYATDQPGVRFQMPLNQIVFDSPTWAGSNTTWLTYSDGPDSDHQITPVPEPSTYGAIVVGLALGLAGYYSYRRRLAVRTVQA